VDVVVENNNSVSTEVFVSVFQDFNQKLQWVFLPSHSVCIKQTMPANATMSICTSQIPGLNFNGAVGFGDATANLWIANSTNGALHMLLSPIKCYPMIIRSYTGTDYLAVGDNLDIVNIVPNVNSTSFILPSQCANASPSGVPAVAKQAATTAERVLKLMLRF